MKEQRAQLVRNKDIRFVNLVVALDFVKLRTNYTERAEKHLRGLLAYLYN